MGDSFCLQVYGAPSCVTGFETSDGSMESCRPSGVTGFRLSAVANAERMNGT